MDGISVLGQDIKIGLANSEKPRFLERQRVGAHAYGFPTPLPGEEPGPSHVAC